MASVAGAGSAVIALLIVAEPYTPATHDWVRSVMAERAAVRDRQIGQIIASTDNKFSLLGQQLLEFQVTQLEGQLRSSRAEMTDLLLKEKQTPDDVIIARRKEDVAADIRMMEQDQGKLRCELNKVRGFNVTC